MKKKTIKKKGGPITKSKKAKVITEIRRLFETGEIMYVTETELSNRLEIARETVRKYLTEEKKNVPTKDLTHITLRFKEYLEDAMEDLRSCWKQNKKNGDMNAMRRDIDLMMKAIEKFTDFLERFFFKQKASENINLNADIRSKQVVINYHVPKVEGEQ